MTQQTCYRVEKVKNGYVVSTGGGPGTLTDRESYIASDLAKLMELLAELFGDKSLE